MTMVANSYLNNNYATTPDIVDNLTLGFVGTLKSWWEKYLTEESREEIKHAI
jgi:hypothetical protein